MGFGVKENDVEILPALLMNYVTQSHTLNLSKPLFSFL